MDMKTDKSQTLLWHESQNGACLSQWAQWTDHQSKIFGYFLSRKIKLQEQQQQKNPHKPHSWNRAKTHIGMRFKMSAIIFF